MEGQEKSFRDLREDERLKKLERQLKLTKIKRPNSSQFPLSPHMSISGISSIHGDNQLSDFSFCSPSTASSSSNTRAASVILASSINLKKNVSKNLKNGIKIGPGSTSSTFEQTLNDKKIDNDRVMMPPPIATHNHHKQQTSINTETKTQSVNSSIKISSVPQNHDNQTRNSRFGSISEEINSQSQNNSMINDREQSNETISRNNDNSSKQYGRVFKNWIVRLNDKGQIIIKGRIESGDQARSKAVKRRINANTVLSVRSQKYHLLGDIYDVREELPEYVRGKFYNGFPTDWENVRQIWQGFVASGFNPQFRWPRPMADSDDDLRSDITDLTIANFKNSNRNKPISFVAPSPPALAFPSHSLCQESEKEMIRSCKKRINHSQRSEILEKNDSDISTINSIANEERFNGDKISSLVDKSCNNNNNNNIVEETNTELTNETSKSTGENLQRKEIESSSKFENFVPRRKVDIIIDNLVNKNVSKEYIDKFITAMNIFNELFSVQTPAQVNNIETLTPDEGVSLNYNSNSRIYITNNKINDDVTTEKIGTPKNVDENSKSRNKAEAGISGKRNSLDLESSEESKGEEEDEESLDKNETYVYKKSLISKRINNPALYKQKESMQSRNISRQEKQTNLSNYSDRERSVSTPSRMRASNQFDNRMNINKNKENLATGTPPRDRTVQKSTPMVPNKRKTVFDSSDSEPEEETPLNKITRNANPANNLAPKEYNRAGNIQEIDHRNAAPAFCDSDVSIVDTATMPSTNKPRIIIQRIVTDEFKKLNQQKETLRADFSFTNNDNEKNDHRSSKVMNQEILSPDLTSPQLQVDQCSVRLTKVKTNRGRNDSAMNKSEKLSTNRHKKSRIEINLEANEPAEFSNSENFSMRMSSRGRRILPPLDYWNGEKVILKGRELIYSPGVNRSAASLSGNCTLLRDSSLKSTNNTVASEPPMPVSTNVKKWQETPTTSIDRSRSAIEAANKNVRRNGAVLSEITPNRDKIDDEPMPSDKRITRASVNRKKERDSDLRNRKTRKLLRICDSSSDDETTRVRRSQKRQRIH